jgi:hypothetical protein
MASSGGDPSGLAAAGEPALSLASFRSYQPRFFFFASLQSINPSEHGERTSSISAGQVWGFHAACEPTSWVKQMLVMLAFFLW